MKNNKEIIYIIFSFVLFTYYIWFKFIRKHLPKDIPFTLSLLKLIILLSIIITFIIMLKHIFKPIQSDQSKILEKMKLLLIKPFFILDNFLQHNNYFHLVFKNLVQLLFKFLFYKLDYTKNSVDVRIFFLIWTFTPRMLMIILFYIDIFYLHKLFLIYIFVYLNVIPLLFKYFIYLMKKYKEEYITFLETWYEVQEISEDNNINYLPLDGNNYTTVRTFLNMQTISLGFSSYKYQCSLKWEIIHKYFPNIKNMSDLTKQQIIFLEKDFYNLIILVTHLDYFFSHYNYHATEFNKVIKLFFIFIYLLYLIGWLYILIISLHTFHLTILENLFLQHFHDIIEPFSETLL